MTKSENMAMPWEKISNTEITQNYNNGKIVRKHHLIELLKRYQDLTDKIIIIMDRKVKNPQQPPKWFTDYMSQFKVEFKQSIMNDIDARFEKYDKLFRQHGWIK